MQNWTANILFLFSISAALGVIYLWLYLKKREAQKFPFSDAVPRLPGQGLSEKINELSFELALYFGLVPLAPVLLYAVYLQSLAINGDQVSGPAAIILLLLAAGAVSYLIIRIFRIFSERHACQLGYAGEVAVGSALNELMRQGYYVFHDIRGDNEFNIDHIAVGPNGVFAIETKAKTMSKKVSSRKAFKVTYDGESLYFSDKPRKRHRDYINQAEDGAKWVSEWLSEATGMSVKAIPVLVFPGWFINRKRPGDILVLNHNQLATLANEKSRQLDQGEITHVVYQIKQKYLDQRSGRSRYVVGEHETVN